MGCLFVAEIVSSQPTTENHQLGTKYSPLTQIDKTNVANLEVAWEYHTGVLPPEKIQGMFAFEDHPTLVDNNLIICTVDRRLVSLNPATGQENWTFTANDKNSLSTDKCRGVGTWVDPEAKSDDLCKTRLFLGTSEYKLIALDVHSGEYCDNFGDHGVVTLPTNKPVIYPGEVSANSDPTVVNDVVVIGSAVADLQRVDAPSGRVLALHARTGELLWEFDPVPRNPADPAMPSWGKGTEHIGQGNVWSSIAADSERDLVFLPTTSVSDDYFGGARPGDNRYSTSVVALKASTGERVWDQQLVHHNVWDYDVPTRPVLIDYPVAGEMVPALVQNTKMGLIFIFNRETGEPLVPIEERPVPQEGRVPGEILSPTQPFPVGMPTLANQGFSLDDVWGFTPIDKLLCRNKAKKFHYGPIYTPITEQGTIISPPIGGGANWGGSAYDPERQIMVVPTNRVATVVQLIPREQAPDVQGFTLEGGNAMSFGNSGSPYVVKVIPLLSVFGAPCTQPPWAKLTAINLVTKQVLWEIPFGSIKKLAPIPINWYLGTPGAGGLLATASGIVFIGYTTDNMFRAFDTETGEVLWEDELPAPGTAVPISYEVNGEQYVLIPAGGHSLYSPNLGDSVVAYKLKKN